MTAFASSLRALLRDERGSATTETVIMIPVFILIFGGLLYLGHGYQQAIDTAQLDRQAAWDHAMDGCAGGVPAGTTLSDATDPPGGSALASIDSLLSSITDAFPPLHGVWPGLFPRENRTERKSQFDRPTVLGGARVEVHHSIVLMCNEQRRRDAIDDMTWAAWGIFGL